MSEILIWFKDYKGDWKINIINEKMSRVVLLWQVLFLLSNGLYLVILDILLSNLIRFHWPWNFYYWLKHKNNQYQYDQSQSRDTCTQFCNGKEKNVAFLEIHDWFQSVYNQFKNSCWLFRWNNGNIQRWKCERCSTATTERSYCNFVAAEKPCLSLRKPTPRGRPKSWWANK